MESINSWDYNVLEEANEFMKFRKLWLMFHCFNFFEKFEIDEGIFNSFLSVIREKYNHNNNPFHNFNHGFTGLIKL